MSLIGLSLAGAAGLWSYSRNTQFSEYEVEEKDPWADGAAQRPYMSTGTYGDISQLSNLVHEPGFVVGERFDTDLTGAPRRWLIMRNGGVYSTYDLETNFMRK